MTTTKGGLMAQQQEKAAVSAAPKKTMTALVKSMMPEIEKALPSIITGERFGRMVMTALSSNPDLQQCTPKSFLGAMMQAAQLGVEPNTPLGQAYLIPYRNKGVLETQFQLGYKGLIDLAYRSGEITSIQAHEVYENDFFEYELGLDPKLTHRPCMDGDRGKVIAYYAVFKTKSGGYGFEVMSKADIDAHKNKFSKAAGSSFSPWNSNYDEMAKKTVIKKCLKYAPIKTEFAREIQTDGTIKSSISADMVDQPDENTFDVEAEEVKETQTPETVTTEAPKE